MSVRFNSIDSLLPLVWIVALSLGVNAFGEGQKRMEGDAVIDVLSVLTEQEGITDSLCNDEISDMIGVVWDDLVDSSGFFSDYAESLWIQEIVEEIYADEIVSSSVPFNVLNYIAGIFSENGFYDSGFSPNMVSRESMTYIPSLPGNLASAFVRPVSGRLTSGFGYRPSFRRVHKGVDISLRAGDTVMAALPGTVKEINFQPGGYGNYIIIAHKNGIETRYAHLNDVLVSKGDKVTGGTPIGLGGTTGNSTGPHLHFETRFRGVAIDPTSIFDFQNSRKSAAK